jgi:hypothetical protein
LEIARAAQRIRHDVAIEARPVVADRLHVVHVGHEVAREVVREAATAGAQTTKKSAQKIERSRNVRSFRV